MKREAEILRIARNITEIEKFKSWCAKIIFWIIKQGDTIVESCNFFVKSVSVILKYLDHFTVINNQCLLASFPRNW